MKSPHEEDGCKPYAGKPGRRHHNTPGDGTGFDRIRSAEWDDFNDRDASGGDAPPINYPATRGKSV